MSSRDFLEKIVKILEKTYYGDVRLETGGSFSVGKNSNEENINTSSATGLCIRAFSDDKWYYLGYNELNEEKILSDTEKLVRRIGNKKSKLYLQDSWEVDEEIKAKKDPEIISTEEKINTVREIFKQLMKEKRIVNAAASIAHSKSEMIFINTEGSILRQKIPYFRFYISAISREESKVEMDYFQLAKIGGYELFTSLDLNEKIDEVVKGSVEMLKARILKGGVHDIIVDPDVSGVIAHESFGHGCEADQVLRNRSYLSNLLGRKIVSELISLHDNSSLKGERGYFVFDDEGIKSSDTLIVKDGVLINFLHDRQSAAFMNAKPGGNARAQDFSRKVFVRMSNTFIEPKDWKYDELIEDTDKGFYLINASTGMEDPIGGNLQVSSQKVREIKNGELGQLFKGVSISGKVLEFLNNVDAVTNDFEMRGSGCGKGHEDYVSVSSGGPYMRIRRAIIG
jgi:TldD protein